MNQTRFDGLQTEGVKSHPVSFAEHREAKREKAIALFCHGFLLTLEEAVEEGDQGAIKIAGDLLSRDVMGSLKALFHIWENQGR